MGLSVIRSQDSSVSGRCLLQDLGFIFLESSEVHLGGLFRMVRLVLKYRAKLRWAGVDRSLDLGCLLDARLSVELLCEGAFCGLRSEVLDGNLEVLRSWPCRGALRIDGRGFNVGIGIEAWLGFAVIVLRNKTAIAFDELLIRSH